MTPEQLAQKIRQLLFEEMETVEFAVKAALDGYRVVTEVHYDDLVLDSIKLAALEDGGVDNWQGYDYAMSLMNDEEANAEYRLPD